LSIRLGYILCRHIVPDSFPNTKPLKTPRGISVGISRTGNVITLLKRLVKLPLLLHHPLQCQCQVSLLGGGAGSSVRLRLGLPLSISRYYIKKWVKPTQTVQWGRSANGTLLLKEVHKWIRESLIGYRW
jgi:hypothetical protein